MRRPAKQILGEEGYRQRERHVPRPHARCLNGSKNARVATAERVGGEVAGDEAERWPGLAMQDTLGCGRTSDFNPSEIGSYWRVLSRGVTRSYLCCIVG